MSASDNDDPVSFPESGLAQIFGVSGFLFSCSGFLSVRAVFVTDL
jgi:hypothetical protein